MKKIKNIIVLSFIILIVQIGQAQEIDYKRIAPIYPYKIANFDGISINYSVGHRGITVFDADNDGDMDVMHAGRGDTHLHINSGGGMFLQELNTDFMNFEGINTIQGDGGTDHADIDQDGDEDLIVFDYTGVKIFLNDGLGKYTPLQDELIKGIEYGKASFMDVNGDSYPDLFLTGKRNTSSFNTELYINDGTGHFVKNTQNDFVQYSSSQFTYGDIDNDDDIDIIISGSIFENGSYLLKSSVYLNDGNGVFVPKENDIVEVSPTVMKLADIDNDNDLDLIVAGLQSTVPPTPNVETYIYKNDGNGNFMLHTTPKIKKLQAQDIGIVDVDGDSDLDLAILHNNGVSIYTNDGLGNFKDTYLNNHYFYKVLSGNLSFIDYDEDGDQDLLVMGTNNFPGPYSSSGYMYENDGNGVFRKVLGGLPEILKGAITFSDIDNDGDQDMYLSGDVAFLDTMFGTFINNGLGQFDRRTKSDMDIIPYVYQFGYVIEPVFADLNNDGYDDLITQGNIVGESNQASENTWIGLNDKSGNFIRSIENFKIGPIDVADVNNDGWLDLILNSVHFNDKTGHFNTSEAIVFSPFRSKDLADIDNDGDIDLIAASKDGQRFVERYFNDGTGIFSTNEETPYFVDKYGNPIICDKVVIEDFDLDGDQDVLLVDAVYGINLFLNDGNGDFTLDIINEFEIGKNITVEDIDQDGDEDILLLQPMIFYMNDGSGNFTKVVPTDLSMRLGSWERSSFGDIDGDGDLDLFLFGYGHLETRVYRNVKYQLLGDSDADGVSNEIEDTDQDGNVENDDTDNDGIPDFMDSDDDGDLVETKIEAVEELFFITQYRDTDNDNISDYLDDDDDGDGTLTKDEDYDGDGNPLNDDTNNNGIPDYLDNTVSGNNEIQAQLSFEIYPNPSHGIVTIAIDDSYKDIQIKIYDVYGRRTFTKFIKNPANTIKLEMNRLNKGNYFIMITSDNRSSSHKLVID